jgi:hypothetical protein
MTNIYNVRREKKYIEKRSKGDGNIAEEEKK